MDHSQRGANGDSSNTISTSSNSMPNVLFREIHKNAFLKRHSSDRRTGFPRKSERVWVVFCVHDDVEPFLEIYPDQKVALTHKPEWFASLSSALHVSPSICGHEDEFEFAVTLSFQVVRLAAPSWESMMEWVETIRNKLRELKVLCPKENLYSRMPEQKQPLLPTRDPNSPLPLPPEGPSILLPGVELVHVESRNSPLVSDNSESSRHNRSGYSRNNINHGRRLNKRRENHPEHEPTQSSESLNNNISENHHGVSVLEVPTTSTSNSNSNSQINKPRAKRATSVPQPLPLTSNIPSGSNITVIEVTPSSRDNHSTSECNPMYNFDGGSDNEETDDVFVIPHNQKTDNLATNSNEDEAHYEHVFLSSVQVTVPVSESKTNVNGVDVNKKKALSTGVLISPNRKNSSQDENVASTSCVSSSNANSKDILMGNSTCLNVTRSSNGVEVVKSDINCPMSPQIRHKSEEVSISGPISRANVNGIAVGKSDLNCPMSPQIQFKLEKVSISGLIPRVPAKSTKLDVSKPGLTRDANLNVVETRRCVPESAPHSSQHLPSTSEENRIVNTESSKIVSNVVGVTPTPAYSQVKKVPKMKVKNDDIKTEEQQRSGQGSPVFPKRKMNEIQVVEVEPQANRKPECLPNVNKNQVPDSSKPNKSSQKIIVNKKPEIVNININKDLNRSQSSNASNSEYRNEHPGSTPSTSGNRTDNSTRINITKKESLSNNNSEIEPITATVQPAVGMISVEDIPLIGGHQRRRRRSSSSDAAPTANTPSSRGIGGADRIRINVPLTANLPVRENHRNESETRSSGHNRIDTEQSLHINVVPQSSRLTLREQQVLQLRKEMLHPGGVRLQLRRKDCTGSIALVDVLNGVWVAGWKQKEHPLLYNALHIGDQLISVGEVVVRSSADAQKLIRTSTNLYIEFIIRRVPFGNVFTLQRTSEGQNLGIVQEGNTAEIKDVLPNSVAARQGLSSKTPSYDGLSLTTWFLTEINGRPLNLFFKDNEVRDRLNAVGKEISILVQPHDFIKQIKKQLKNMRSYKEYIVQ